MDIDWSTLGFHYTETDYIVRASFHGHWINGELVGEWSAPYATRNKMIPVHAAATGLQYGQQVFEGLKVFRGVDGKVRVFRWKDNALRMQASAVGLKMAPVPVELFEQAMRLVIAKNKRFIPPYETGATLYLRPILFGSMHRIAVGPGHDFEFVIVASPIGPYYPGKFHCTSFIVNRRVDRSALFGTGAFKAGGNYGSSFRATEVAHLAGYDCLFLDSKFHRYIDECSAANFIGIKGNEYLTPRSTAILPSITNKSLMMLAKKEGLKVTRRKIRLEELADMQEAAACGTACVISPIDKVYDPDHEITYNFGAEPGPILTKLYHDLQDIQYGRVRDTHHWCTII